MDTTPIYDCAICGQPVADHEVIAVRHSSGTVAHEYHSSAAVKRARIAAGTDPDTAEDVPATCERSNSDLFCRTHGSYWSSRQLVCERVLDDRRAQADAV